MNNQIGNMLLNSIRNMAVNNGRQNVNLMLQRNPQVMNMLQGQNPETVAKSMMRQMGIDNSIIQAIEQMARKM